MLPSVSAFRESGRIGPIRERQSNWTTKIEYAHFRSTNIPYPDGAASIHSFKVRDRKNIIQIGLNYYFP